MWNTQAGRKLTPTDLMDLMRPALERLINLPRDARVIEAVTWEAVAAVILQPDSGYRVIDRDRIWAYPAYGPPEQYLLWRGGMWHVHEQPDGDMQRVRVSMNEY